MYQDRQHKYFAIWKKQVVEQQKFELRCLDKTKDILMDELTQSMQVNEALKVERDIDALMKYKCTDCITKQLVSGNLFGDDSDEKEATDPKSDPLSD